MVELARVELDPLYGTGKLGFTVLEVQVYKMPPCVAKEELIGLPVLDVGKCKQHLLFAFFDMINTSSALLCELTIYLSLGFSIQSTLVNRGLSDFYNFLVTVTGTSL